MQMVQPAMGYYSRKTTYKKEGSGEGGVGVGGKGVEDMKFPSFIKKKNNVEFPGVLV